MPVISGFDPSKLKKQPFCALLHFHLHVASESGNNFRQLQHDPRSAVDVPYGLDGVIQGPGETGIIFWRGPIDVDISVPIWYLAPMHHISCQPLLLSGDVLPSLYSVWGQSLPPRP
ncbi:hypothetical protein K438DRAFT_1770661 [Mycena galopus ATCC 62051]|nr:hypothetical protein K438DRAFT_1770661 [Mycena galopus ATCC 62051]